MKRGLIIVAAMLTFVMMVACGKKLTEKERPLCSSNAPFSLLFVP